MNSHKIKFIPKRQRKWKKIAPHGTQCFVVFCTKELVVNSNAADPAFSRPRGCLRLPLCLAHPKSYARLHRGGVGRPRLLQGPSALPVGSWRKTLHQKAFSISDFSLLTGFIRNKVPNPYSMLLAFSISRAAATASFRVLKYVPPTTGPLHTTTLFGMTCTPPPTKTSEKSSISLRSPISVEAHPYPTSGTCTLH